ncbi:hypothetical protein MTO96_040600, partial [Rhipicephalus appendiculatus]
PALLYLVPACIGVPLTLAAIMGDISALLKYEDYPAKKKTLRTDQQRPQAAVGKSDKKYQRFYQRLRKGIVRKEIEAHRGN